MQSQQSLQTEPSALGDSSFHSRQESMPLEIPKVASSMFSSRFGNLEGQNVSSSVEKHPRGVVEAEFEPRQPLETHMYGKNPPRESVEAEFEPRQSLETHSLKQKHTRESVEAEFETRGSLETHSQEGKHP